MEHCVVCGELLQPADGVLPPAGGALTFHRSCAPRLIRLAIDAIDPARAEGPDTAPAVRLTRAERRILKGIVAGRSNSELARDLGVSVHTVRNQISALLLKLEVATRTEAAVWAVRSGVVR